MENDLYWMFLFTDEELAALKRVLDAALAGPSSLTADAQLIIDTLDEQLSGPE